jgi:hypothetical protein
LEGKEDEGEGRREKGEGARGKGEGRGKGHMRVEESRGFHL